MLLASFLRMGIIHLVLSFSDREELTPKIIFHTIYYRLLRFILFCYSVINRERLELILSLLSYLRYIKITIFFSMESLEFTDEILQFFLYL
jgi:hypothetical protein